MVTPNEFLNRLGLSNQKLQREGSGGDWDLIKLLERFWEANNVGDLLNEYWQRESDACPLEATLSEKEEAWFKEWVQQQNK